MKEIVPSPTMSSTVGLNGCRNTTGQQHRQHHRLGLVIMGMGLGCRGQGFKSWGTLCGGVNFK